MKNWYAMLELALMPLQKSSAQCHDMTYVISHLLREARVNHHCRAGYTRCLETGTTITPHCWIELEGGWIADLTIDKWLESPDEIDYPHGVFDPADWPNLEFYGQPMFPPELDEETLIAMSDFQLENVCIPALPEATA